MTHACLGLSLRIGATSSGEDGPPARFDFDAVAPGLSLEYRTRDLALNDGDPVLSFPNTAPGKMGFPALVPDNASTWTFVADGGPSGLPALYNPAPDSDACLDMLLTPASAFSGATSFAYYTTIRFATASDNQTAYLFRWVSVGEARMLVLYTNGELFVTHGDPYTSAAGALPIDTEWHLIEAHRDGAAMSVVIDGSLVGQKLNCTSVMDTEAIAAGHVWCQAEGVYALAGYGMNTLMWNRALTETERGDVRAALLSLIGR